MRELKREADKVDEKRTSDEIDKNGIVIGGVNMNQQGNSRKIKKMLCEDGTASKTTKIGPIKIKRPLKQEPHPYCEHMRKDTTSVRLEAGVNLSLGDKTYVVNRDVSPDTVAHF
ncbi:MAG: hypothetical protein ACTSUE_20095 [Promethearchaeota archaeon]